MRTLYDAFAEYVGRRKAILKALTTDVEHFWQQCDPNQDNLCLYGHPNGSWTVGLPAEEVPTETPEPTLGINYARDGMKRQDWLSLVAIYSDSWLMSLAFFMASRLDKDQREELFSLMNKIPTCYDIISGRCAPGDWETLAEGALHAIKPLMDQEHEMEGMDEEYEEEVGEEEGWEDGDGEPCPTCGKLYREGEFWIACDFCNIWYCGRCAKMNDGKARQVRKWKCPGCMADG
ncbi:hypothetical protein BSKO_09045 [Bryopsis sp. KO-2023]|nr:hypothetical protein BSKO_09045 [Bryopsis sp. KO-2023]